MAARTERFNENRAPFKAALEHVRSILLLHLSRWMGLGSIDHVASKQRLPEQCGSLDWRDGEH